VLSVTAGCIRLLARLVPRPLLEADIPVQTGFATGRMAGAVARNRIRRQLREVYRRHQTLLIDLFLYRTEALTLMVLFRGTGPAAVTDIRRDLPEALRRLVARVTAR
jgi:ribonuclease P protein component